MRKREGVGRSGNGTVPVSQSWNQPRAFLDVWRRLAAMERRFDRAGTLVQTARRKDLEIIGNALHEPAWPAG